MYMERMLTRALVRRLSVDLQKIYAVVVGPIVGIEIPYQGPASIVTAKIDH
jgi:hypothetical protein